jgi:hypothetical protein
MQWKLHRRPVSERGRGKETGKSCALNNLRFSTQNLVDSQWSTAQSPRAASNYPRREPRQKVKCAAQSPDGKKKVGFVRGAISMTKAWGVPTPLRAHPLAF